jgi:hypothetical protein
VSYRSVKRVLQVSLFVVAAAIARPSTAAAQGPPPPITGFVVDVRGTLPQFDQTQQLADSRGLIEADLPGSGFGLDVGATFYPFKWKAITFGLGGQVTYGRSHSKAGVDSTGQITRAVTERFVYAAPQISFNFGDGNGWSYVSGGIGPAQHSVIPDGSDPLPEDSERLRTINYGGGARWFLTPHVAFHFDVRFYAINVGTPFEGRPASPRSTLLILGAGFTIR